MRAFATTRWDFSRNETGGEEIPCLETYGCSCCAQRDIIPTYTNVGEAIEYHKQMIRELRKIRPRKPRSEVTK